MFPGRRASTGSGVSALRQRLIGTLVPAAVGCFAGYMYAEQTLPPDVLTSGLVSMYATMGAAAGILVVRVVSLGWMIVRDLRDRP